MRFFIPQSELRIQGIQPNPTKSPTPQSSGLPRRSPAEAGGPAKEDPSSGLPTGAKAEVETLAQKNSAFRTQYALQSIPGFSLQPLPRVALCGLARMSLAVPRIPRPALTLQPGHENYETNPI